MSRGKLLVYLVRRDLRIADNPILHHLATTDHGFSHFLPIFVLPPHQIEVSGFLAEDEESPYPPALSKVGKFWRCGPNRAKFLAQSIWDMKQSLETLESGLAIRVGRYEDVVSSIIESLEDSHHSMGAVWMTEEKSFEEEEDQKAVSNVCNLNRIDFKLWEDEKYFIDDRDTGLKDPQDLPDIFTTYRKTQEPLLHRPRPSLPCPVVSTLPPLPPATWAPPQKMPFVEPKTYDDFEDRLLEPIQNMLAKPPVYPHDARSAHPFLGGESQGWDRLFYLCRTGGMVHYKETRNGLVGTDYSTKLAGYLALGCLTARQVHGELLKLENGLEPAYALAQGFGKGECEGTKAVRFELLWRDYMRLCTMKFGYRLFRLSGFKGEQLGSDTSEPKYDKVWKSPDEEIAAEGQDPPPEQIKTILDRFLEGNTGMGLIDAAQRELYHTGYTSNRARQNVASFFSKHLGIDWRYGAEWYEAMLVDYDVSSNWANWQYVAGVGNDPRGDARIFNPVKQAFDYDNNGQFVRTWVPEVKHLVKLENVFQVWTSNEEDLEKFGLTDDVMVTDPIHKIEFMIDRKPRPPRRHNRWKRGSGRGGGTRRVGSAQTENDVSTGAHRNVSTSPDGDGQYYGGDMMYVPVSGSPTPRGNWNPRGRGGGSWRSNAPPGLVPGGTGAAWPFSHPPYIPPPRQFIHPHPQIDSRPHPDVQFHPPCMQAVYATGSYPQPSFLTPSFSPPPYPHHLAHLRPPV
ncbi:DNA photolyase, FAD-binding/Cryptochrome [Ilyonectria robusta]|uniref:DNA photolyase, FAD-binding/Cryptochrome n=1 Tax=Ilyonectria robusta TaxID=1079257 RepID=UPI001E8E071E|nr:DNA photolyase, FAD-binding/Cryptochrome [Ilyonectria robusta]KAH8659604.1 DNA photolyase, FAD-binding/Cryptochrome [Ilyonectria robusta]